MLVGNRALDLTHIRKALEDKRIWCGLGVVVERDGSHFEQDEDEGDVYVEVELMPDGIPLTCRLGSSSGGANHGVWKIPPVGTEVAVMFSLNGDIESDAMIVSTLSSGGVPGSLDDTTLLVTNTDDTVVESTEGNILLSATQGDVDIACGSGKNVHVGDSLATESAILGDQLTLALTSVQTLLGTAGGALSAAALDPLFSAIMSTAASQVAQAGIAITSASAALTAAINAKSVKVKISA